MDGFFGRLTVCRMMELESGSEQLCAKKGGGGYLTNFNTGRLRPEVQPLTLSYTILAEIRYPFYIVPFIEKRYAFHIPILEVLFSLSCSA